MPSLSDATIRAAPIPAKGQKTIWDGLKGFGCRISQGGSKTFIVMIESGRRQTIGRYPTVSLSEARAEAKRILAEKQLGKLRPARVSFDQALAEYLEDCEGRLRPRSLKNYKDYLALFPFKRRSLADITTREIVQTLKPLSPSQREHANRVFKTFTTWCVRHSLLDQAPNTPPVSLGRPRTRVLTEDELRAVWTTARVCTTPYHALVALLCLTGARRGEIAGLRWSWIGTDYIEWPGEAVKNGRSHRIPIGPETQRLLASLPPLSDYVFPALRQRSERTTVMNGWSKAKVAFDKELGDAVAPYVLHDLRRSYATALQRLGVRIETTECLLGHVSGTRAGIIGVYQQYEFWPEQQQAALTFETWLTSL